jgi:YggT family protein
VALLLVQLAAICIELWLSGVGIPPVGALVQVMLIDLARKILQFYLVALIIYAVLSWVAPGTYSPASSLLDRICEPLINPVRRVIPPIGGLDLSVVFVMILLGALLRLL